MDITTLRAKGLIGPVTAAGGPQAAFPFGFARAGLHEVIEAAYGQRGAATGFLLALAGAAAPERRSGKWLPVSGKTPRQDKDRQEASGAWLWVSQRPFRADLGHVPAATLQAMCPAPPARLSLTARTLAGALWAVEEAVVSGAVSLVIAELEAADFTATRRLALASGRHGVPVLLLLPPGCAGPTAAATRWRIAPRPSAPNRFDPKAPGRPRWQAVLERCRAAPHLAGAVFDLEWNDETLSLGVVPGLAAGPAAPRPAQWPQAARRKAG